MNQISMDVNFHIVGQKCGRRQLSPSLRIVAMVMT